MEGPPPGTVLLDKYRVDWVLGVGGYGYVVRAHHLDLGESVAIKILREDREADPQTLARFVREAQLVVRLKSEHVARVFDVGRLPDTGAPYIVMELLEGEDLHKLLGAGPLPVGRAVDFMLEACEAIAEAHALGIVHRDLKPGNLFLARLPTRSIIKVLDFGISKSMVRDADIRLTQTQSILGTPAYMAPEQMRDARHVDHRADIWALGAVLYELVEGELPFCADNFAELVVAVSTQPPPPMQRARELQPIIDRCLAKSIEDRFASVAEFTTAIGPFGTPDMAREYIARIHRLLGAEPRPDETPMPRPLPPGSGPVTTRDPTYSSLMTIERPRRSRGPLLAMLAGAALATIVIAGVLALGSGDDDDARDDSAPMATDPPASQPAVDPPIDAAPIARAIDAAVDEGSATRAGVGPPQKAPARRPVKKPNPRPKQKNCAVGTPHGC